MINIKKEVRSSLILMWIGIILIALWGGIKIYSIIKLPQPETRTTQPVINRIDLLTCQGEIFGTFYFFEADQENDKGWVLGNHAQFIDYRGRKIQYSGNYLVTPIPDTVSVNSNK